MITNNSHGWSTCSICRPGDAAANRGVRHPAAHPGLGAHPELIDNGNRNGQPAPVPRGPPGGPPATSTRIVHVPMSTTGEAIAPLLPTHPATDLAATAFPILASLSFCHLLNDMIQSLLPAIYPLLKSSFALDFGQIGLITLTFQFTASLLQPMIGTLTDRHPKPYSLAFGMGFDPDRPAAAVAGAELSGPADCGGPDRNRLGGVPSGILAYRTSGFGRSPRTCAVACSRLAATSARPPVRCSPPSSSCRADRPALPGSRWPRWSRSSC